MNTENEKKLDEIIKKIIERNKKNKEKQQKPPKQNIERLYKIK